MSRSMRYVVGVLIGMGIGELYGLYVLGPMMDSLEASLAIGLAIGIGLGNGLGIYMKESK